NEKGLLGSGIGTDLQSETCGVALDHRVKRAVRRAEGNNIVKGVEHGRAVHVDVRDDAMDWHGGEMREVIRAEQAFFLRRYSHKQDGACRRVRQRLERFGD